MNSGSECIVVNEKQYCAQEKKISIGGVDLIVKDPEALLRAAKKSKSGFKKTGLYDDYDYVPVVYELARQNDFEYKEFILFMVKRWSIPAWNPFKALHELEIIYDELPYYYKGEQFDVIVGKIVVDIERSLGGV